MSFSETSGRFDQRNFVLNIAEGVLWIAGASFLSAQTVLPALVTKLGGGNVAVGALGVILWVGLFLPQMFAARYAQAQEWKKPWAIRFGLSQRIAVLLLAVIVFGLGDTSPALALCAVLTCYACNQILLGITTPGWFDMFAKLTPANRRGRLTGIRNALAGALSFLCGLLLTWLLATFPFPTSYALAFVMAFSLQLVSIVLQSRLVEEFPSPVAPQKSMSQYLAGLHGVLRSDRAFRTFLITCAFLIIAAMPMSFYVVYALDKFGMDEQVVGEFTLLLVGGQIVGATMAGFIADRRGNRLALACAAGALLLASFCALTAPSIEWFRLSFVFLGMNLGSELMVRYNISAEYAPVDQRSTYLGLMNTVLAPFYLASLLGGWLSDAFGYIAVFATGLFFSAVGIVFVTTRMEEPRHIVPDSGNRR